MSKIFEALRKAEQQQSSPLLPPVLAPSPASVDPIILSERPMHPRQMRIFEREFSALSTAVQSYFPSSRTGKVVMVVGCVEGEGSSYVSANLSRTLARTTGAPILFIDGDCHGSSLNREFAVASQEFGLVDFYQNGSLRDLPTAIQPGDANQLYVLPNGRSRVAPVAYYNSPQFENVLESVRRTFRFAVVDSPPLLKHPDSIHLATHVDGVVLVVRHKNLTRQVIRKGIEMLEGVKAPILGAVLNRRKFAIPTLIYRLIS